MSAADTLAAARALGVVLSAAGGELRYVAPAGALSPELRAALVEHKAELLAALAGEADAAAAQRAAASARRSRALALLAADAEPLHAVVADAGADPVLVTVAVRGKGTVELAIPAADFEPGAFLALVARLGSAHHCRQPLGALT